MHALVNSCCDIQDAFKDPYFYLYIPEHSATLKTVTLGIS